MSTILNAPFPGLDVGDMADAVGAEVTYAAPLAMAGPRRLARMSLPVCIMDPKAGQPQWMMEASGNERPQWRPDDAEGAASRDARTGHGAEGGGDPGGRARPRGAAGRRGRGAAGDSGRSERMPGAFR